MSAPSATGTTGTVEAWSRQADGRYQRVAYFPNARIGAQGMGATSEGLSRTPTGRFKLTQPPYGDGAVRGKGSAFFLHVKNSSATAGCVAVAASELVWLLRWFRSSAGSIIAIGVGSAAYNPIPRRYT